MTIKDAFNDIVQNTLCELKKNTSVQELYFMQGHPKEIVDVLASYTQSPTHKNKKYPLIALLRDFKEKQSTIKDGVRISFNPKFIICTLTSPTMRADEREVKNFIPVLHPIFNEFIYQITQSEYFGMPHFDTLNIEKWDRYYWGNEAMDKNKLNDHVDAVEISNIDLNFFKKNC